MGAIEISGEASCERVRKGDRFLRRSAMAWYATAAAGQLAFIWMILAHYGRKTLAGDLTEWNDKPLIKGFVAGDDSGNAMFAVHVLLAGALTFAGLLQLIPIIRSRTPWVHRWSGRLFLTFSGLAALGGLWLTWGRQTYLSLISAIAVSLDGVLVLLFATLAWRYALTRDYAAHRRWALRTFMVVNGVWFLRIGIMAWVLLSGGGVGMNRSLSGPADIVLQFGAYLVPLAILEVYLLAQQSASAPAKYRAGALLFLAASLTLVGTVGAIAFMWGPYML